MVGLIFLSPMTSEWDEGNIMQLGTIKKAFRDRRSKLIYYCPLKKDKVYNALAELIAFSQLDRFCHCFLINSVNA